MLSLIAIIASLCCVVSGICAYTGGIGGYRSEQKVYFSWALFYLAIVIAALTMISKLNRKPPHA